MLKVGDTYQISKDLIGEIIQPGISEGCWWDNNDGSNDKCFSFLNKIDKQEYQKSILGYSDSGEFPVCKSLEDLEKFLHKITEDYNLDYARKTYTKGTKYYLAHITDERVIISEPEDFKIYNSFNNFSDLIIIESHGNIAKNGHYFAECILTNGKWAEIIQEVQEKMFEPIIIDGCSGVFIDCKTSLNDVPITIKSFKKSDFEVGDTITIIKYPDSWSSLLNSNCPSTAKFPITGVIKKLKQENAYTAMDCCGYGWNLITLIKRKCISKLEKTSNQSKFIEKDSNPEVKVGDYLFVLIPGKYYGDILKVTELIDENKIEPRAVWIRHINNSFSGGGFRYGKTYKYGESFRHATQEEITNYLVSTGELKVNTLDDVKPWDLKVNFILPIDDEDLPMVNIVKTKIVKVLDIED